MDIVHVQLSVSQISGDAHQCEIAMAEEIFVCMNEYIYVNMYIKIDAKPEIYYMLIVMDLYQGRFLFWPSMSGSS